MRTRPRRRVDPQVQPPRTHGANLIGDLGPHVVPDGPRPPLSGGQGLQAGDAHPSTSTVAGLTVPAAVVSIGKNRVDSLAASSTDLYPATLACEDSASIA